MPRASHMGRFKGAAAAAEPPADIERIGSHATYVSSGAAATHQLAYTVAASGANRKLPVLASCERATPFTLGMTYNGIEMEGAVAATQGASPGNRCEMFWLDDEDLPTDGMAHNFELTIDGDDHCIIGTPGDYRHVAQGAPSAVGTDTDASGGAVSITLTGVAEGALVLDGVTNSTNDAATPGGSQTELFDVNGSPDAQTLACSHRLGVTAGNVTMDQADLSGRVAHVAAWWPKAA